MSLQGRQLACGAVTGIMAILLLVYSGVGRLHAASVRAESPVAKCLSMLNVARPDMVSVDQRWKNRGSRSAMHTYKRVLVTCLAHQHSPTLPDMWLWRLTNAQQLMRDGVVKTLDYGGGAGDVTTYAIGIPPNVNWRAEPPDGYLTAVRDIATMQWDGALARAFIKTGDPRYATRWLAYWADFAKHWPAAAKQEQHDPKILRYLGGSIKWPSESILYLGWRIQNFVGYLQLMAKAHPLALIQALGSHDLAVALNFEVTNDLAQGVSALQRPGGVPNQRMELATAVLWAGTALTGMKGAQEWRSVGLSAIKQFQRTQTLPDGTSVEQSFNYNKNLPATMALVEQLVMNLPHGAHRNTWLASLSRTARYRWYFLNSLITPDGKIPGVGNLNPYSGGMPWPSDFSGFPLSREIYNTFHGEKKYTPAFTSIYLPYGGYAALRTGWGRNSFYSFFQNSRPGAGHHRQSLLSLQIWAYGKPMLVSSGSEQYSNTGDYCYFFGSTVSENSISVDGYSQLLDGDGAPNSYAHPIRALWHTGRRLDFIEGAFKGPYGGWNFLRDGTATTPSSLSSGAFNKPVIRDVVHRRQVFFLRQDGVWIVVDRILSKSRHRYTQSWCFPYAWTPTQIAMDSASKTIKRDIAGQPGVEFYQFGPPHLRYSSYYGIHASHCILGWVSKSHTGRKFDFYPDPDVHADWAGSGDQILVTLIVPNQDGVSRVKSISDLSRPGAGGFSAVLSDGTKISFEASLGATKLKASGYFADAKGLLVVRPESGSAWAVRLGAVSPGFTGVLANAIFDLTNGHAKNIHRFAVPRGFLWSKSTRGTIPDYDPETAAPH